jgi:hypothetical protein
MPRGALLLQPSSRAHANLALGSLSSVELFFRPVFFHPAFLLPSRSCPAFFCFFNRQWRAVSDAPQCAITANASEALCQIMLVSRSKESSIAKPSLAKCAFGGRPTDGNVRLAVAEDWTFDWEVATRRERHLRILTRTPQEHSNC